MKKGSHVTKGRPGSGTVPVSRTLFDFDWRFANGDVAGAEKSDFKDGQWEAVDLPHDFAIYGPFEKDGIAGPALGYRPLGIGWYRKSFPTPGGPEGRRVWLEFEGVYRAPKVWVNGMQVVEHSNGYTGFECDVTALLKPAGKANVVAVRADNTQPWTSRWYTGGGIYRHVWLRAAGGVHVVPHGIFVTTPKVATEEAWVTARTEVRNAGTGNLWAALESEVVDARGECVACARSVRPIRGGETITVAEQLTVAKPQLWGLAEPHLYRVVSRLSVDGDVTDERETTFGIREIRVTPDGLFLNGKRELLKGFCIHHDLGCLGAAAFDRAIEERLQTMQEMGCNAVRLSHNPHAPALLDLCDRMGVLVYDEAFDDRGAWEFYAKDEEAYEKFWPRDLEWFVRRDRNHPSVFIWSVGNEGKNIFVPPDYGVDLFIEMSEMVRRLDSTRPITQALYPMRWNGAHDDKEKTHPNWREYEPHQMAFYMDVMSANYMEKHYTEDRAKYPQLSYIASESGTGGLGRGAWRELDREHAVGIFYWGGIDYLGESGGWPSKGWSLGYVDVGGFRKPSSYDVEARFSSRPMVYLTACESGKQGDWQSHWNFASGAELKIEAYSNSEEVELVLNGKSLGVRKRDGEPGVNPTMFWDMAFAPGRLVAVARSGRKEVARCELKTAGAAKSLRLTADSTRLRADGQDLARVVAEVVDAEGVVVPDARNEIVFAVTGAGTNAGVDNGDLRSDELLQGDRRSAWQGRALVVVRATRKAGKIVVKATAAGLGGAVVAIAAEKA